MPNLLPTVAKKAYLSHSSDKMTDPGTASERKHDFATHFYLANQNKSTPSIPFPVSVSFWYCILSVCDSSLNDFSPKQLIIFCFLSAYCKH